jgi:polysaccharide export outer membrane protein
MKALIYNVLERRFAAPGEVRSVSGLRSAVSTNIDKTLLFVAYTTLLLAGCSLFPSSGPSRGQVAASGGGDGAPQVPVIELNSDVVQSLLSEKKVKSFSETLDASRAPLYVVAAGDVVQVSLWEAPPPVLFGIAGASTGSSGGATDASSNADSSSATGFPNQMVASDGTIEIPFAGHIFVSGKTPQQIEGDIQERLKDKAHLPQVIVTVVRNSTSMVTVVGDVDHNLTMPLTSKGERLLDALAAAGGVKQAVGKMTIQLTRGTSVQAVPLDEIIRDPRQNILLQPRDVITALYQPNSFTALGAVTKNDEINFEAQGISLAQALGRIGGLQDLRSDPKGVFIFRFEEGAVAASITKKKDLPSTEDGRVPMVYVVDLKNPATFLLAQNFPVRNKDVIYVANAPAAELQKFLNILYTSIFSISNLKNL